MDNPWYGNVVVERALQDAKDYADALNLAAGLLKNNYAATADPAVTDDTDAGYAAGSIWLNGASGVTWRCRSAAAGAAVWLPVGGLAHPGYISGNWYVTPHSLLPSSTAIAADILYAIPVQIHSRVTLQSLCIRVATLAAGASAKVGIYSSRLGRPNAKLTELSAPVSVAATGSQTGVFTSNPVIDPGWVWLASLFNGAPTMACFAALDPALRAIIGSSLASDVMGGSSMVTGVTGVATYTGGLPSSFGTSTVRNAATPLIAFQPA